MFNKIKTAALALTAVFALECSAYAVNVTASKDTMMYTKPNKSSVKMYLIEKGTSRKVIGETKYYYQIKYNGMKGYVSKKDMSSNTDKPSTGKNLAALKDSYLFAKASKNSDVIEIVRENTPITVISETKNYYKISYAGTEGYIAKKNVGEAGKLPTDTDNEGIGAKIAQTASEQIGKPFAYGGTGPDKFDVSGLCYYACKTNGINIPRNVSGQFSAASSLQIGKSKITSIDELKAGDMVFFSSAENGTTASYNGIYVGNGEFVYAGSSSTGVKKVSISGHYYSTRFILGVRF